MEGSFLARIAPENTAAAFKRYFPGMDKARGCDIDGDGYYRGGEFRQEGESAVEYLARNQQVIVEYRPELVLLAAYPDTWDLVNLLLSGNPSAEDVSAIIEAVHSTAGEERQLARAWLEKNQTNPLARQCLEGMGEKEAAPAPTPPVAAKKSKMQELELYLQTNGGLENTENIKYLIKCLEEATDAKDDPLVDFIGIKLSEAVYAEVALQKTSFMRLEEDKRVELMRQAAAFRALLLGNSGAGTEYGSLEYDLLGKDCNFLGKQCAPDADAHKMKGTLYSAARIKTLDCLLEYMASVNGKPVVWKAGRRAEMIFRRILQDLNANPENKQYLSDAEPGSYGIELFSREHLYWAARCTDEYGGNEGDCLVQKFDPSDLMTRTEVQHVQRPLLWFEGSVVVETYHYRYMRAMLGHPQDWLCNDPIDYEKGQDDLLRNPPPDFTLP